MCYKSNGTQFGGSFHQVSFCHQINLRIEMYQSKLYKHTSYQTHQPHHHATIMTKTSTPKERQPHQTFLRTNPLKKSKLLLSLCSVHLFPVH
jgi:hypothetical protein